MKMNLIVLSIATFASFTSASVPSLTPENINALTTGKSVFIKYFIPGCGNCQAMASAWEELAAEWGESDDGFIGEIDCDAEWNIELCEHIKGFPTLKFGKMDEIKELNELEDYDGERDFENLSEFAEENLKISCSVSNIELCDDKIKNLINELQEKSKDDLITALKKVDENVMKVEENIEQRIKALENDFDEMIDTLYDNTSFMKEKANYKHMQGVLALKISEAVEVFEV